MVKVKILQPVLHDILGSLNVDAVAEVHETVAKIWADAGACEYTTKVIVDKPFDNKSLKGKWWKL